MEYRNPVLVFSRRGMNSFFEDVEEVELIVGHIGKVEGYEWGNSVGRTQVTKNEGA
jgi:hypothetical protein